MFLFGLCAVAAGEAPADEGQKQHFQKTDGEEAVLCAEHLDNGAHEKASEGGASQKDEGIEAHDASQIERRTRTLDGGIAVDEEENGGKTHSGKEGERREEKRGAAHEEQQRAAEDGAGEEKFLAASFAPHRGDQSAGQCAGPDGEQNGAEAVDAPVKYPVGKERAIGAEVHDEAGYDGHGQEIAEDDGMTAGEQQAFPDLGEGALFLCRRCRLLHVHPEIGKEDGHQ